MIYKICAIEKKSIILRLFIWTVHLIPEAAWPPAMIYTRSKRSNYDKEQLSTIDDRPRGVGDGAWPR